jgi:hypothetical protein
LLGLPLAPLLLLGRRTQLKRALQVLTICKSQFAEPDTRIRRFSTTACLPTCPAGGRACDSCRPLPRTGCQQGMSACLTVSMLLTYVHCRCDSFPDRTE